MSKENIEERLIQISTLLKETSLLWTSVPFVKKKQGWERQWPHWSEFLRSWSEAELELYEQCPEQHPNAPKDLIDLVDRLEELVHLRTFEHAELHDKNRQSWFIKKRKWNQVKQLSAILSPIKSRGIIDWCGGKGHLGRNLAIWNDLSVHLLERQSQLCEQAKILAQEHRVALTAEAVDVFSTELELPSDCLLVSLHACGQLSERAMKVAVEQRLKEIAISPCCYHVHIEHHRKPLSQVGAAQEVKLSRLTLMLPSFAEQFSSAVNRQRRRREMAYRQGLDLLLREHLKRKEYRSFRSIPTAWKDLTFEEFVRALQEREGFSLPENWMEHSWEEQGWKRSREARSLGAIRNVFRRPIELWVVLDRALWLKEHSWEVEVGVWCSSELTPRNILLKGSRKS